MIDNSKIFCFVVYVIGRGIYSVGDSVLFNRNSLTETYKDIIISANNMLIEKFELKKFEFVSFTVADFFPSLNQIESRSFKRGYPIKI